MGWGGDGGGLLSRSNVLCSISEMSPLFQQ